MELRIERVTALPGTLTASTMYIVSGANNQAEVYFTGADAAIIKHTIRADEVQAMINSAIAGFTQIQVVANIAARDALTPDHNIIALVVDATGDATVTTGAAMYLFEVATPAWVKVAEYESMDLILQWSNIQGRPSSTVADIDDAVSKRHVHANKTVLDDLSDVGGVLKYKGDGINANVAVSNW